MPIITSTQEFIATARAYWLAIGELAEAASRYSGDDFKRQAGRDFDALEKTLKTRVKEWNEDSEEWPGTERVVECAGAAECGHLGKCDIYISVATSEAGYCKHCADQLAAAA